MNKTNIINNMAKGTKTAFFSLLLLLSSCFLSSCEEHDERLVEPGNTIGNIWLSNNTYVTPEKYDPQTMEAVGVVFHVSQKRDTAYVVAITEIGSLNYADSLTSISGVSSSLTAYDGYTNTAALVNSDINCPGAQEARLYESPLKSWFLPSASELRKLHENLRTVQVSMDIIGGDGFSDEQYLSSSQDGSSEANSIINCYCVSLTSGYVIGSSKLVPHRVRPVLLVH